MLTDTALRKAKAPDKPVKLADSGGLYVLLQPNGGRWWRWDYRRPVTGKRNTLSFGTYPDTSLAEARGKRDDARRQLAAGIDPGVRRRAEQAAGKDRVANSFEAVAREWLGKQTFAPSYTVKVEAWFSTNVFPWIGDRPVAELNAPDFLAVLRRVEARGAHESAHRIKQNCGQVMRYAIATGRAFRDPTADLKGALTKATERHHPAITDSKELAGLLRAMAGFTGTQIVKSALELAPLVFVRPSELCAAEWAEFDLDGAQWVIPAARMKTRQAHLVPLSSQAVVILRDLYPLTGRSQFVFPSARTPHANGSQRPLTTNALLAALHRLGYKDAMTTHGFRATARTILDEQLGFRVDYIEHQLAHSVRDPNGRAYNRTSHLPERRKMMQAWADYLDSLRSDSGNVLSLKRRAGA